MRLPAWSKLPPFRRAEIAMLTAFSVWLLLVVLSPFTLAPDTVEDLSGKVGEVDNGAILERMNPLARVVYTLGDINCHQLSERSLYLNGNQMPFCARDVGIFLGLVVGILLAILVEIGAPLWILVLLLVPMGVDGVLQLTTGYESSNLLRLITGTVGGIGIGLLLSRFARQVLDPSRASLD